MIRARMPWECVGRPYSAISGPGVPKETLAIGCHSYVTLGACPGYSGGHYAALEAEPKATRRGLWQCEGELTGRRWCKGGPCEPFYKPRGYGLALREGTISALRAMVRMSGTNM